jgi:hypothetical protein
MATLAVTHPTLLDLARVMDPSGKVVSVIEILNETNEILEDMVWQEGNLLTGHMTSVRTGLPAPTWRKLYGGVQPAKSTSATITDSTGMLEAYAEVDKALADINSNSGPFRTNEDRGFLEGMNQEMADTIFYGNEGSEPEAFTGFAPRFNLLSAANGENIIDAGGTGTDNQSIWLVVWGPNTCHGIIPKGSRAGFQITDKGQVTIENIDGSGGRMEAYRTHYRWDAGLTVRDWRYVVRIANIDKSMLIKDMTTGADLQDLMIQALELIPNLSAGRSAFYMSRRLRSMMSRQAIQMTKSSTLTMEQAQGSNNFRKLPHFQGVPIRRVDAISADEARVV